MEKKKLIEKIKRSSAIDLLKLRESILEQLEGKETTRRVVKVE